MHVSEYAKNAAFIAKSGSVASCPYCGSKTIYAGSYCFCSGCEALIYPAKSNSQSAEITEAVSAISKAGATADFKGAISACDAAFSISKSPWFLYIKGIVQIEASNNETSLISYDKPGFMEENAEHRYNASELYAAARLSLFKAVNTVVSTSKEAPALDTNYLAFLASIKLKDYQAAKHYLDVLSGHNNDTAVSYSKMLLFNGVGTYRDSLLNAEKLLSKTQFSVNALYYAAFALFKLKKKKEAKAAIETAIKYISTQPVLSMFKTIKEA